MFCKSVAEIQLNQPYVFKKLDLSSAASEFVFSISHVALSKLMELLTQVSATLRAAILRARVASACTAFVDGCFALAIAAAHD